MHGSEKNLLHLVHPRKKYPRPGALSITPRGMGQGLGCRRKKILENDQLLRGSVNGLEINTKNEVGSAPEGELSAEVGELSEDAEATLAASKLALSLPAFQRQLSDESQELCKLLSERSKCPYGAVEGILMAIHTVAREGKLSQDIVVRLKARLKEGDLVSVRHRLETLGVVLAPPTPNTKKKLRRLQRKVDASIEIADMAMEKFFKSLPSGFTRCPSCALVVERAPVQMAKEAAVMRAQTSSLTLPGRTDLTYEDAAMRWVQCRFRCPVCSSEYCAECRRTPFHFGMRCETVQARENSCRYCEVHLAPGTKCKNQECVENESVACSERLACGHACGMTKESRCGVCLVPKCQGGNPKDPSDVSRPAVDGLELCNICWTDDLRSSPCVQLLCGHAFHYPCVKRQIQSKWRGDRITFSFLGCPLCSMEMSHPSLETLLQPFRTLRSRVHELALRKIQRDRAEEKKVNPGMIIEKETELLSKALSTYAFYECSKCTKPFHGGLVSCAVAVEEARENLDQGAIDGIAQRAANIGSKLVCGGCTASNRTQCSTHGQEFITWKCHSCCVSISAFNCGSTHWCQQCHDEICRGTFGGGAKPCVGLDGGCMFKGDHPDEAVNGVGEFCLGCGLCEEY